MTEDELRLQEEHYEWEAARQRAEEEEQIARFQEDVYDTGDQINYLLSGYFPNAMRTKSLHRYVEAFTMLHLYGLDPNSVSIEQEDLPF